MRTRSSWRLGRRVSAVALALVAAISVATLFAEWHVLREHAIDSTKVMAALYNGPDYRVSDAERARLLHDGMNAGVTERACTGLDHFGSATPIALAIVVVLALITALSPSRISAFASFAGLTAAIAASALAADAGFLRHLFGDVGPDTSIAVAFHALQPVVVGIAAIVCLCVVAERRSQR